MPLSWCFVINLWFAYWCVTHGTHEKFTINCSSHISFNFNQSSSRSPRLFGTRRFRDESCFSLTFLSPPRETYAWFFASILGAALMSNFLDSIFTFPPPNRNWFHEFSIIALTKTTDSPGLCVALSNDPIFDWTFLRLGEGAKPTSILFIGIPDKEKWAKTSHQSLRVITRMCLHNYFW